MKNVFTTCKRLLFSALDFLFYLPFGGETTFRRTCREFIAFNEGDAILELCCGAGEFTGVLAQHVTTGRIVGTDISRPSIEAAVRNLQNTSTELFVGSAACLPLSSKAFDTCIVSFGMHHMSSQERKKTMEEIHRVLQDKGSLYIFDYMVPDKGINRLIGIIYTLLDSSKEAYNMAKNGSLTGEIEQAGFEIKRRAFTRFCIVQFLEIRKRQYPVVSV